MLKNKHGAYDIIYIYINNFYKFYEIYKIYLYHIIFSRYLFKLTLFSKLSYFELL